MTGSECVPVIHLLQDQIWSLLLGLSAGLTATVLVSGVYYLKKLRAVPRGSHSDSNVIVVLVLLVAVQVGLVLTAVYWDVPPEASAIGSVIFVLVAAGVLRVARGKSNFVDDLRDHMNVRWRWETLISLIVGSAVSLWIAMSIGSCP